MEKIEKEKIVFHSPSSISVTDTESPETFPLHWHNAAEFTVALMGDCKYRVNDTLYTMEKGDVLLVWPQQIHATVKIPQGGALFIQFPSVLVESNLDLVSISRFLYHNHHIKAKEEPELASFLSTKIFEIKKIHNSADPLSETRCKLCIYEILLRISEYALAKQSENNSVNASADTAWNYVHGACNFINENAGEAITQAEVAAHVGLSVFYFSKLFKQYMHMSFPAYLSEVRVKSAASLLLNPELSITECAFASGFQSTTAFNKAFHDITGYSPRDYRKMYR
ncbi:MAG: helix-turn-helix domain-containing protein [Lachnospiraceae bacterium]|nr:helix-turn-helix domain-containing protein [Lachnospiraceae bacterium]